MFHRDQFSFIYFYIVFRPKRINRNIEIIILLIKVYVSPTIFIVVLYTVFWLKCKKTANFVKTLLNMSRSFETMSNTNFATGVLTISLFGIIHNLYCIRMLSKFIIILEHHFKMRMHNIVE